MGDETNKPIVYYRQHPSEFIVVGQLATVLALDHPQCGTAIIFTTLVTKYDVATGEFETLDIVYRREETQRGYQYQLDL